MNPTPACVLLAVLVSVAPGQITWTQAAAGLPDLAPFSSAMAFDAARARTVLAGAASIQAGMPVRFVTFEWDGANWVAPAPAVAPPPRLGAALGYDAVQRTILLFGGALAGSLTPVNDTWVWNGTTWIQRTPLHTPPALVGAVAVTDAVRGRVLLVYSDEFTFQQWEWDGSDWSQPLVPSVPPPRAGFGLAFDAARGRAVLFGGAQTSGPLNDTWELDGSTWSQRASARVPPARYAAALAYDAARGRTVLFGGAPDPCAQFGDTWEWDGSQWTERLPLVSLASLADAAMVFDSARERLVLWGGVVTVCSGHVIRGTLMVDTWELAPLASAAATPFGLGCHAVSTPPDLTLLPGQRPWLGDTVTARLQGVPVGGGSALLALGRSRTRWGSLNLPLDLGPSGMPGCALLAEPLLLFPAANVAGTAALPLALPASPDLLGVPIYLQGFATDPTANPAGVAASAGLLLQLGGR